jgi:hypothetical protein
MLGREDLNSHESITGGFEEFKNNNKYKYITSQNQKKKMC